jgi:hypothetical protein
MSISIPPVPRNLRIHLGGGTSISIRKAARLAKRKKIDSVLTSKIASLREAAADIISYLESRNRQGTR